MNNPTYQSFIGLDVGKYSCSIFDSSSSSSWDCPNNLHDLQAAFFSLKELYPQGFLVICEATGGYEALLLSILLELHIPVHRADAAKVKAFIRSWGTRAKSDSLDAKAISLYAQERYQRLPLYSHPDDDLKLLSALSRRRKALVHTRVQELNRYQAPDTPPPVLESIQALLDTLNQQIASLDQQMSALLQNSPLLKQRSEELTSVVGIGKQTAHVLLCHMPELGTISGNQAASLAGLAPHPKESGQHVAYRRTQGGRPELKPALFLAALTASRHHPTLKLFYKKLLEAGKKPIVAIIAVARRLIVILNAKLRDLSYNPAFN